MLPAGGVAVNLPTGSDASSHTVGCDADVISLGMFINITEMTTPEIIQMTHNYFHETISLRDTLMMVSRILNNRKR
jgi:hypothetical protein